MAGRFFILRQVEDFAPGFFDNTAIEDGCVQLSHQAGSYPESGSYISLPFQSEAFFSLIPCWNADTPEGTGVEMFVRLSCDGRWSQWFSFGRWSPHRHCASPPPQSDELAKSDTAGLEVLEGNNAAEMVQMRVNLYTEDADVSPQVRLLAVSTNAAHQVGEAAPAFERALELPAYSCLNRDPALAGHIASVTTLTMMMNRWGRDLLPEELARTAFDANGERYDNLAFLCAAAAVYGFSCYVSYAGIARLRREVWQGRAAAARVHYRAEDPPGYSADSESVQRQPVLEGAVAGSTGHLVAVCGFIKRDGAEYVVLHDPLVSHDIEARREVPLAAFARIYTGLGLFVRRVPRGVALFRPQRRLAWLKEKDTRLYLYDETDEELLPARLRERELLPATLCYTLSDGVAYASQAQKRFFYPSLDEEGRIRYDGAAAAGHKLTFYFVASQGNTWVAEKTMPALPPAPSPEGKEENDDT